MKAAVIFQPGPPENFVAEERPTPKPGANQVLVAVRAFGLNRSELMTRKGFSPSVRFPRVLGIECVGEVVEDPSGEYGKGQQVAACMGEMGRAYDGSYAEYVVLPKSNLFSFSSTLPWEQLGAIPEMFHTVHGSLHSALQTKKGEILLIRGGTSSVGLLAAQLAHNQGLTVVATTRNPKKEQLLLANGAAHVVIDGGDIKDDVKKLFPGGVHKALELVGTTTLKDTLGCVRPQGIACMTGMLSEQWSIKEFAPMDYVPAAVCLTTFDSGQLLSSKEAFQAFIKDVETGAVRLPVGKVFRLDQIIEAHQLMENNAAGGKIVVLP
ncbi:MULTISPECIES: zinc-binding alcohol dehydrogenase family protein [unclassified Imperialibacter]|uniref:zinc-binding alcohol dehydrogenase family protein n=1 Tax=unclassified Imperialibacter TaxID=2629706 RepID=UPI001256264D|nr:MULTISPECIES: zinc-binding alcohol dehydrogenase family protein [unclassified Imperialibacter]CAD5256170.1 NADPH:quinone reductase [Imperialibacter sp. 89]CAD5262261.1 NADPH:quinone reductase [Imperialibacter sp. 75]VVT33136.1 NADPH:quinone reductase [Imperialibacter sp. EC-SDR9]